MSIFKRKTSVPVEIRKAVLKRDKFACVDCGVTENLEIDHIQPKRAGGKDTVNNCQTVCQICNNKRWQKLLMQALFHWYECPFRCQNDGDTCNKLGNKYLMTFENGENELITEEVCLCNEHKGWYRVNAEEFRLSH